MATRTFVGSNKENVFDVKVNMIKQYFISHTKIDLKSPKFETFKTEESNPLVIIKNIKTRKSFSEAFIIETSFFTELCVMTAHISCRSLTQIQLQIPRWRTRWRP